MSLIDLYNEFGINYATEEHPSVSRGWVGVHCPFCSGSQDYHLGAHLQTWGFNCWRCGKHQTVDVLVTLLGVSEARARSLIRQYREGGAETERRETNKHIQIKPFKLPSFTGPLQVGHEIYLEKRGFDPFKLEKQWGLLGTGPVSMLDHVSYKFRIVAPIMWDGQQVSFQARDYTGKADRKYMACVPEREFKSHKTILYGQQKAWGETGICVEGITDVWRLGPKAFATFGIEYTTEQVLAINDHFSRVVILFDPEPQAQSQARELASRLRACGTDTVIERLTGTDPGGMAQDDADALVRDLLRRVY